jgi:outer membrane lipoprotein-sorting protein
MKALVLVIALAGTAMLTAPAQQKRAAASGEDVLERVAEGVAGVDDYTATIEADINMERVRIPTMHATMYYKKPDKFHFTSTNFAMLPREGLALTPELFRKRYVAADEGEDTLGGKTVRKLHLTAKERRTRPAELDLWIDPAHWTVVGIQTVPYMGRILRVDFEYALQKGKYWLPSKMTATFDVARRDTLDRGGDQDYDPSMQPPMQQQPRLPTRSGTITVRYLAYVINSGLSDDIFERKEETPKER